MNYPVERGLDGIYFRVQRNGKWKNICFSDLTSDERNEVVKNRSNEWLESVAFHLADTIRRIGDSYGISSK